MSVLWRKVVTITLGPVRKNDSDTFAGRIADMDLGYAECAVHNVKYYPHHCDNQEWEAEEGQEVTEYPPNPKQNRADD